MKAPMLRLVLPALAGLVVPAALAAQLPRTSARALGLLRSQTATARGYDAIAWNPALLAMPGRPRFSLNVVQVAAREWSNSVDAGDIFKYSGDTLTTADKDTILAKIPAGGPFTLGAGVDAAGVAVTVGNFGIFFGGQGDAEGRVSRDFAELLLYGNVQRRGVGSAPFTGDSSGAAGWAGGTAAIAMGLPIGIPAGHLAVGATVKLTQGIMIGGVEDLGSMLQTNPFVGEARVHLLYTSPDSSLSNGFGLGADLGVAWELLSGIRLGLAIENVFSTMSWSEDDLLYERREYRLEQQGDTYVDSVISEIESSPFNEADPLQAALRDSILGRATFPTRVRAGAQLKAGPVLLAGDAMIRIKRGLVPGEARRLSAAAELPLAVVALRGGLATDLKAGITFGGGLGLKFGPVRLDTAANWTPGGDRQGLFLAVGLGIMN
jgi:hypothetical protein